MPTPRLALVALVLSAGLAHAEDLQPKDVGRQFAGEWEGQIQLRNASEKVSASRASMSASRDASNQALEMYYEGFAFGRQVQGAMILSFDAMPSLSVRDLASGTSDAFFMADSASDDTLIMENGVSDARAVFSRNHRNAWSVQLQAKAEDDTWVPTLTLQLDRMGRGEHSAAAASFANARPLMALRRDRAIASVPTD